MYVQLYDLQDPDRPNLDHHESPVFSWAFVFFFQDKFIEFRFRVEDNANQNIVPRNLGFRSV